MNEELRRLITDLGQEIEDEKSAKRSPEEQVLHRFCQQLLLTERELRAPGSARTQEDRVTKLLSELANARV